ncbi:MAG: hypothetical protein V3V43_03340 [Dehalococcoidales bacterium]
MSVTIKVYAVLDKYTDGEQIIEKTEGRFVTGYKINIRRKLKWQR